MRVVRRSLRGALTCGGLVAVATLLVAATAMGYPTYHPSATGGCFQCHPGFDNRGPLHDLHVGDTQMTSNCFLCHTTIGDNPSTNSSAQGVSCIGCHLKEGLRLHHKNAGAPPDNSGLTCMMCHPNDAAPGPETTLPPYYPRSDVDLNDPCATATPGGEDYSGDGQGLDNDGDLLYDGNDPDCVPVPVEKSPWGAIKALYRG